MECVFDGRREAFWAVLAGSWRLLSVLFWGLGASPANLLRATNICAFAPLVGACLCLCGDDNNGALIVYHFAELPSENT